MQTQTTQTICVAFLSISLALTVNNASFCQALVPGTGVELTQVSDDFEETDWSYRYRRPKSSQNIDKNVRLPGGSSVNGRWGEGAKRGQPDLIRTVETPPHGLAGSTRSLMLRSQYTGLPRRASRGRNQDDLLMRVRKRMGRPVNVSSSPSIVVRVHLPPWEYWENASGASFGFRGDVKGVKYGRGRSAEPYWPGFFIRYAGKARGDREESAQLIIRGNDSGRDYNGPKITETGWWTLGMSFTPDGRVHYYASPGIDDLTAEDHLASHFPYHFRCRYLDTVMFNVINSDSGGWSTPWVIDDPTVYAARSMPEIAKRKKPRRGG